MKGYYIYHITELPQLLHILNDGILYANKYIEKKYWRMLSQEDVPYIFTRLFLDEPFNKDLSTLGIAVILDPKLLLKQSSIYNDGWVAKPDENSILLNLQDDQQIINNKINTIFEHVIKNDKDALNEMGLPLKSHEVMFIGRIILKDYLVGIMCPNCDESAINKIKKTLKIHQMDHIKIFTGNSFPDVKKVVS